MNNEIYALWQSGARVPDTQDMGSPYEFDNLRGVYSSLEKAVEAFSKLRTILIERAKERDFEVCADENYSVEVAGEYGFEDVYERLWIEKLELDPSLTARQISSFLRWYGYEPEEDENE